MPASQGVNPPHQLIRAIGAGTEKGTDRIRYRAMARWNQQFGVRALLSQLTPLFFGSTARRDQPQLIAEHQQRWAEMDRPTVGLYVRALVGREDIRAQLASIDLPTLVLVGDLDQAEPPRQITGDRERYAQRRTRHTRGRRTPQRPGAAGRVQPRPPRIPSPTQRCFRKLIAVRPPGSDALRHGASSAARRHDRAIGRCSPRGVLSTGTRGPSASAPLGRGASWLSTVTRVEEPAHPRAGGAASGNRGPRGSTRAPRRRGNAWSGGRRGDRRRRRRQRHPGGCGV
jgi:hypothetical protein